MRENLNDPLLQEYLAWHDGKQVDEIAQDRLYHYGLKFDLHLRAFFWELDATFDTMLQWANQRYKLGVSEGNMKWEAIKNKQATGVYELDSEWKEKYQLLDTVWNSAWYFEVRMYRNFAHRTFNFVQHAFVKHTDPERYETTITCLPSARDGQQEYTDIMAQLQKYLDEMRQLGANIFSNIS
jgi:hypothetical protein